MLKITIESDDETRVVDFSLEEQKAYEFVANMPIDHIENAIRNRVRVAIIDIVKKSSDKQPEKISDVEKLTIVGNANIESAAERQARLEAENQG